MKLAIFLTPALLLSGSNDTDRPGAPGGRRGAEVAALGHKLLGVWRGGGCDGRLVLRADRTYELTDWGPGASDFAGTWQVRGDALPATLALYCKTSTIPEEVGKTLALKVVRLDAKTLAVEYANLNGSPAGRYTRAPGR